LAVRFTPVPSRMPAAGAPLMVTVGVGFTVTVTLAEAVCAVGEVLSVTVTVYVVVMDGETVTGPELLLKPMGLEDQE